MKIIDVLGYDIKNGIKTEVDGKLPDTQPDDVLQRGLQIFFLAVGIIAVCMIVYSGIQYIVSVGDRTKIESAKKTLLYAVVGLIVSASAFVLVSFVMRNVRDGS
jgi:hypothetical protein